MRNKFGFAKEWMHFTRTFRFGGMLIGVFSMALANPLLYKFLVSMMSWMEAEFGAGNLFSQEELAEFESLSAMTMMFDNSGVVFSGTMMELCGTALLITMLLLMAPCGGEQKKRATIIPLCSGLDYKDYLIPKFLLYPLTYFATNFVAACVAGFLCDAMFTANKVGAGNILLTAALCAVYTTFILTLYMAIGLCNSRPGVATIIIYLGQNLVVLILASLGLTRFNPFTLYSLITGGITAEGFSLEKEMASILVAVGLSIVIAVLMFFLTLAVLRAKRINNQAEDKPEF